MSTTRHSGAFLHLSLVVFASLLALAWIASTALATGSGNRHLLNARSGHSATAQFDGSLLFAGGTGNNGVAAGIESLDLVSGKSTPGPRLLESRSSHSATLLADGRVLLAGGNGAGRVLASTEIYDPSSGSLVPGARLNVARAAHTATTLVDGRVLFAGGDANGVAEIYDPVAERFQAVGRLAVARSGHSAIRLGNGTVLLVGGTGAAGATAEIFDPASLTSSAVGGGLKTARVAPTLKLLSDGKVQVYGGDAETTMEIYNPAGYFSSRGHLLRDSAMFPSLLHSPGHAALIGTTGAARRYAEQALGAAALAFERSGHSATEVAARGSLVVAGGRGVGGQTMNSIETIASCSGTVTTDLTDYYPGQTVVMSGSGWAPGEQITLNLHRDTNDPPDTTLYAVADENGDWINAEYVVQDYDLNVTFVLTASGDSGCSAQTTFTDALSLQSISAGAQSPSPVASGNSATFPVSVRFNGSASVACVATLSVTAGLPAGTSSSFSPNPLSSTGSVTLSSTLTIGTTAGTTPAGTYTLTLQATAPFAAGSPSGQSCSGGTVTTTATFVVTSGVASTTTTLASSLNPSTYGDNVTFTATVVSGVNPVTTGSVTFIEGGTCAAPTTTLAGPTALNGSGQAAFSTAALNTASHTITACFGATPGFSASSGSVVQVVNPATSTTTVSCPASVAYTGTPRTPCTASYTTSDGLSGALTPTYTNNTNAGTANASATYAGDANHATSSDSKNFTITQATSTTTVTCPASVAYSGSAQTPCTASYTTSDGLSGALTPTYTNNTNAGTANASATYAGDANHATSSDSKNFTITQATSTTTVTCPASVAYSGSAQTPCTASYTTSDGQSGSLTPTYSNNTNAGLATASATYAGDANHATSSDSKTFTITQATSTTTVTCPASVVYNGFAQTPCTASYTTSDGLSGSLTPSYTNNTNAGTANASATYAGDANHESSSDSKNFTIDKATSTTTVSCPANVTYTGSPLEPCTASYTTSDGLSGTLTPTYSNNTDAGTASASATYAGDANHESSSDSKNFTIDKAPSTTTLTCPASVTYTGSPLTPCSATVTGAGGLNQSVSVSYTNNTDAGTANASATFAGDANHLGSSDSKTFTIDKASSTTTLTCPASVTYTGSPLTPCSATVTGAGGLNQSVSVSYTNNINAGTANASATFAGDANHLGSSDSKTFTIDKGASTTTVTCPASVTYNGAAQTPCSAAVTGAGGLNQSLTVSYANNVNAGTATASASYPGDANHLPSSDSKNFTIDKASSTTTVTCPAHVAYTGLAQTPCSATVTGAGGLSMSLVVSYSNNVNAGTAGASATYPGDANHYGSSNSATFVIDPALLTVTADNKSKIFGDPNPTLTYTITGFVNNETVSVVSGTASCSTTALQFSPVGTYPITCTVGTLAAANYTFTFKPGTLTIGAREALVNYIGQTTFVTSGSSATTAQVTLSASVQDPTGLGLSGAKMDFIDTSTGKTLAAGVPVSPVPNSPNYTGTANAIVTLSTGQYGAESYLILVRMTGNYTNINQPAADKTANVVVAKPATTNQTTGGGSVAGLASAAGTYAGIGDPATFTVGLSYNKSGSNLQGKITVSVPQADGVIYVKSNSISSMAVKTNTSTIYTKATVYEVLNNGTTVTIDGNVTLRMDVQDGPDMVGFTVLSSKDSTLYYSNNWVLSSNVWKTGLEGLASGMVTIQ